MMERQLRLSVVLLYTTILGAASACSHSQTHVPIVESEEIVRTVELNDMLMEQYQLYALHKENHGNLPAARYYYHKAQLLRDGLDVEPEKPLKKVGDSVNLPAFKQAQELLVELIADRNLVDEAPKELAETQFRYDCWLQEYSENPDSVAAYKCRELFYRSLDQMFVIQQKIKEKTPPAVVAVVMKNPLKEAEEELEKGKNDIVKVEAEITEETLAAVDEEHAEVENSQDTAMPEETGSTIDLNGGDLFSTQYIYFAIGQDALDDAAKKQVEALMLSIKGCKSCKVALSGHSDSSGSENANLILSMKRANVVKQYFLQQGLPKSKIYVAAYGEGEMMSKPPMNSGRFVKIDIIH